MWWLVSFWMNSIVVAKIQLFYDESLTNFFASNPSQFLHLLETFQRGLDIRHGIVGILKFATE